MEKMMHNCELCNGDATLYCPSDNAFLCYTCDTKVHCANFLVARHVRSFVCPICNKLQVYRRFSGACVPPFLTHGSCENCTSMEVKDGDVAGDGDDDSLSCSSSCVSSTGEGVYEVENTKRRDKVNMNNPVHKASLQAKVDKVNMNSPVHKASLQAKVDKVNINGEIMVADLKVEGVLVNWCRRMGVEDKDIGAVVNMAVDLVTSCSDRITCLPFRVLLAACFWVASRVVSRRRCGSSFTCQDLKRVEQISGVPTKLILATEVKLARVVKRKQSRDDDHKEGWAEC